MSHRGASREELLQTIKTEALRDSQLASSKKRFGLFNYQTPIAICDCEIAKLKPLRDSNGQVITKPRNMQTTIVKSGKIKSSYLSVPSYITIGDQYVDPDRQTRLYELEKKMKIPKDQPVFKPSCSYNIIAGNAPYKHESDLSKEHKIQRINSEHKVIVGPYNITSGPYRFGIKYPHIKDEYERLQESQRVNYYSPSQKFQLFHLKKKEIWDHKAKIKDKPPFSNADVGNRYFFSERKTFEVTDNMRRKEKVQNKVKVLIHEQPFKYPSPGKKGYNRTINRYPKYMESPVKEPVRRRVSVEDQKRDSFKVGHPPLLTGPNPTVSCNHLNLRKEILSSASAIQFKN